MVAVISSYSSATMRKQPVVSSQEKERGEIHLIMTSSVPTNHILTQNDLDGAKCSLANKVYRNLMRIVVSILCPVHLGGMFIVG